MNGSSNPDTLTDRKIVSRSPDDIDAQARRPAVPRLEDAS
jgi:hypothetical protein